MEVSSQFHTPAALSPEKSNSLYLVVGWTPEPLWIILENKTIF